LEGRGTIPAVVTVGEARRRYQCRAGRTPTFTSLRMRPMGEKPAAGMAAPMAAFVRGRV